MALDARPKTRALDKLETARFIGARVKRARENARLTQTELGDALGFQKSWISDLERGQFSVLATDLNRIARQLRHPITWFLDPRVPLDGGLSTIDWAALFPGQEKRARAHQEVDEVFDRTIDGSSALSPAMRAHIAARAAESATD